MTKRGRTVSDTNPGEGLDQATREEYQAPTIVRLGTLAELTLGDVGGFDDGLGGNGDTGGSL